MRLGMALRCKTDMVNSRSRPAWSVFFPLSVVFTIGAVAQLQSAHAGPVADELRARGSNVPLPVTSPKKRPTGDRQPPDGATIKPTQKSSSPSPTMPAFDKACFEKLTALAIVQKTSSPVANDPACLVPSPVQLTAIKGKVQIELPANPVLDCPFALSLATYARKTLVPLATTVFNQTLVSISTGEGFICRRRNNNPAQKLSEHAFGNAIDIVSFVFENETNLAVQASDQLPAPSARFLDSARSAACEIFTTVLGPGTNAAHATHFHFDLGRARTSKNPYRICQ